MYYILEVTCSTKPVTLGEENNLNMDKTKEMIGGGRRELIGIIKMLSNFYSCTVETTLTSCLMEWYGSTTCNGPQAPAERETCRVGCRVPRAH